MSKDAPSSDLSNEPKIEQALQHNQDSEVNLFIPKKIVEIILALGGNKEFFEHINKTSKLELTDSYQTLVLQPFKEQIEQRQLQSQGHSAEDLASELSTRLQLKEINDFKVLYWLARAYQLESIIDLIETEKNHHPMLFLSETRNNVVFQSAKLGDQETFNKLLNLANNPLERMAMLNSAIDGACKAGQVAFLRKLEQVYQKENETSYQQYLNENGLSLLSNACASGNLESVEFILNRLPDHKRMISEVDQGYQYHPLREACRSGNTQLVDRLLKPFTPEEIDRIFSPTVEETKNLPLPLAFAHILAHDELAVSKHILKNVVSAGCREKLVTSEFFAQSLAQAYGKQDKQRYLGLLAEVPHQQFELVRRAVNVAIDKPDQKLVNSSSKTDGNDLNSGFRPQCNADLDDFHVFSKPSSRCAKNESRNKIRLSDNLLFSDPKPERYESEKDKKQQQRAGLAKS